MPAALLRLSILTWGRQLLEQSPSPFLLCSCSCRGCDCLLYLLVFSTAVSLCMGCFTCFAQIFCLYSGEAFSLCPTLQHLVHLQESAQRGKTHFGQGAAKQTEVLVALSTSNLYLVVEYFSWACGCLQTRSLGKAEGCGWL